MPTIPYNVSVITANSLPADTRTLFFTHAMKFKAWAIAEKNGLTETARKEIYKSEKAKHKELIEDGLEVMLHFWVTSEGMKVEDFLIEYQLESDSISPEIEEPGSIDSVAITGVTSIETPTGLALISAKTIFQQLFPWVPQIMWFRPSVYMIYNQSLGENYRGI